MMLSLFKTKLVQALCAGLVLSLGSAAAYAGTLSIKNGATLYGKGSVTAGDTSLEAGAFLAPGASPGCLATANLSLANGSQFNAEIEGTTVCTQYDKVSVTGSVSLNSATLNASLSGYTLQGGDSFTLIDNDAADAVSGIFSGLAEGSIFTLGGKQTSISYVAGDGNDVALQVLSDQLITFNGLANKIHGDSNFVLNASTSSGLPVSFASTTPAVCSVSGYSVALLGAGSCSITASQAGNANYNGASDVGQSFTVNKADQVISFNALADKTFADAAFAVSASSDAGLSVSFASTTTGVCTLSGSTVTLLATGSCSISASQAGSVNYNAATDVVQTFSVNKSAQTITFNTLANKAVGDTDFALSATSDSGLSLSFASTTAGVCTVSGATVSIVAAGSCSITASQSGDTNYNAATDVVQGFTVNKGNQTITFSALTDKTFGDVAFNLSATSSAGLAVSYASTTTAVCTLSGNTVTMVAAGTCSVTSSQAGDANYNSASDVVQGFTVNQAAQTINFSALAGKAANDADFSISATASSGLAVSFVSTTAAVCSMSGDTVSIVTSGACSITASQSGNSNYAGAANVVQGFTVNKANQAISFNALSNKTFGDTNFTLSATADSGLTVSFASTTTGVCTVSGSTVSVIATGSCSLTASQTGDSSYNPATDAVQNFSIGNANQTITFATLSNTAFGGAAFALGATSDSGLAVSFASSTAAVCTVSGSTLTIVGSGSCSVIASQSGNANYNAATDVVQGFTVNKANQAITFNALASKSFGDASFALSANSDSGLSVSFASTTVSICTVSGSTVSIVAAGSCSITASQTSSANYNAATDVIQGFTVAKSSQSITFNVLSDKTFGDASFAVNATADSGLSVSFASTTAAVCTVSGSTISVVATGSCSITAAQSGNGNYLGATNVIQSFNANKANQLITFNALADKTFGDASFALSATADSGLAVSFASTTEAVCTVSGLTVSIVSVGSCLLTASQAGSSNYNGATDSVQSFNVGKANQAITFDALADKIFGDVSFAVNATADSGLAISFSSTTAAVCTVSGSTVSIVATGSCSLTASQAGSSNYNGATDSVQSFNVAKANQAITFNSLAGKTFGDADFAISAASDSGLAISFSSITAAVCTVSGPTVSILAAGNCSITASQAGNTNYNAATDVVQAFTVNKANQAITFNALADKVFGDVDFVIGAASSFGLAVSLASTTPSVCTLSGSTVTLVSVGSCSITASQSGNENYNAATNVIQSFNVNKANQTISFNALADKTFGDANFTVNATANSGLTVSFASTTAGVCTVSGLTVTVVSVGNCSITASQTGDGSYNAATDVVQNFNVNKASQTITFGALGDQEIGSADVGLSASSDSGLTVSFVSTAVSVCTVSGSTVSVVAVGNCSITASQTGDASYSAATDVVQSFNVLADATVPVITLLGDANVIVAEGAVYADAGATASDNVDGNITANIVTVNPVNTANPAVYTVTYNVSDASGNAALQVTRTVTVTDNTAPVVTAPAGITVAATDVSGTTALQTAIATFLASASATDAVDGVITTITTDAPTTFPLGETTVTFSANDAAGNTGINTAAVTITDQSKPVITLSGNSSVTVNYGSTYTDAGAVATDNVDGDLSTSIVVTGSVDTSTVGNYSLNFNVNDGAGNAAVQVIRNVSVQDNFAPVVTAPANITVAATDASGTVATNARIAAFLAGVTANDDVDGVITPVNNDAPATFPLGVTAVTFSVMDTAGNTGQAQATVSITDQTVPVLNLTGSTSLTLEVGESFTDPGFTANDNVDGDISGTVVATGTVNAATTGLYTLNYNVSDAAGNAAVAQTRQVTVQDSQAPVVTPPTAITVAAVDANGVPVTDAVINAFLQAASATDAVDGVISSIADNAPAIFPLGVTTVTFSATDNAANTGMAQAMVTVTDQAAPIVTLNGSANITLVVGADYTEQEAAVTDNVDTGLAVIITGTADTNTVGNYTLTYTATDAAGNNASVMRMITVQANSAPVVTAPANIIIDAASATGTPATETAIANFLVGATVLDSEEGTGLSITHNAPATFAVGQTTVTFSSTDSHGGTGSAQAIITVVDQSAPVITLNGEAAITLTAGGAYTESGALATDTVDGDLSAQIQISGNVNMAVAGTYQVTYSVTDTAGNIGTEMRTVTVEAAAKSGSSGGAMFWPMLLIMLLLTGLRQRRGN